MISDMKKQHRRSRKPRGFALLSLIVLGAFSLGLMMVIAQNIQSIYNSERARRYSSELRCAAESGVEFAIGELTSAALSTSSSALDPSIGQSARTTILPNTLVAGSSLGASNSGFVNGLTLTLTVRRYQNTPTDLGELKKWSSIYSRQLDSSLSTATDFDHPAETNANDLMWRVVECKASLGGGVSRTVRVVLQPVFDIPANLIGTVPNVSDYFQHGAFGNNALSFDSNVNVELLKSLSESEISNKAFKLGIASNRFISIGDTSKIRANVSIFNFGNGPTSSNVAVFGNSSQVNGILSVNNNPGLQNVWAKPGPAPEQVGDPVSGRPPDNVLASAELNFDSGIGLYTGTRSDPNTSPVVTDASQAQSGPPPSQSGQDAQPLPSLGDVANSNSTLFSNTGDWSTSSLSTSNMSTGSIDVSTRFASTNSAPVRIFVDDSGNPNSNSVDIDASKFIHSDSPTSLQIWYSGTRNVSINASQDFAATIYAPNAQVSITGTGSYLGAVTGKVVNFKNTGGIKLLSDLSSSSAGPTGNMGLVYAQDPTSLSALATGYRVVSWQELSE